MTLESILKKIRKEKAAMSDVLISGAAEDYSSYREIIGELTGLSKAESIVLDLIEKGEDAD